MAGQRKRVKLSCKIQQKPTVKKLSFTQEKRSDYVTATLPLSFSAIVLWLKMSVCVSIQASKHPVFSVTVFIIVFGPLGCIFRCCRRILWQSSGAERRRHVQPLTAAYEPPSAGIPPETGLSLAAQDPSQVSWVLEGARASPGQQRQTGQCHSAT